MKIRISETLWNSVTADLLEKPEIETAGLLFGRTIQTTDGTIVLHSAKTIPESAYNVRKVDQLSIDPIALNRLTKQARDNNWSIFTIHTHPNSTDAWFSAADDIGDARLMPSLTCQIPDAPHGSMVLSSTGVVSARVFSGNHPVPIPMNVIGKTLKSSNHLQPPNDPWFSRQQLALGKEGQAKLKGLRVAIVGLGGIGSLISMQLAHLGVGEIVLIDGDSIEPSNVSRIVGASATSVGTSKVEIAAQYAESTHLPIKVEKHPEYLSKNHEMLIAGCDIAISCVDTHTARALLNRWSYEYLVPLIDLGTVFRVNDRGIINGDAGRVVTIGPGRPCLACWGHLDPNAIRTEALSASEKAREVADGYIEGANIAQPSVIAFNTTVAGAGVTELLRMTTAFAGAEAPPNRLSFSFKQGVVSRNSLAADSRCSICGPSAT